MMLFTYFISLFLAFGSYISSYIGNLVNNFEWIYNMTKNSRNYTEKSYSTTDNGMPECFKSDAFLLPSQNPPTHHTLTYQSVVSLIHVFQIHKTQINCGAKPQKTRLSCLFFAMSSLPGFPQGTRVLAPLHHLSPQNRNGQKKMEESAG